MQLTRWDPFRELEEMSSRLNRFFGEAAPRRAAGENGTSLTDWTPAIDVEETDGEFLVKADLPEVKKEDVRVEVEDGMLSMSGERRHEKEERGRRFHRVERAYGRFERRLALPRDVDAQKIAADFQNGVLQVHLPKSPAGRPQSLVVPVK